ncbi:thioredoxin family protein [Aestuariirhabdus sp. Z084]|uniref:thioredoxin family protein n=1 Tax=Aestuariirhabdus haliotis TaxID=2918751 RepID=UPI00201B389E|nr:thioredoxin family protein [Aestuariirhabdus haliotis]MCL6415519.1 thioredoxin family protein [Aestuariirhabdus haliotis]MCL6419276.1 thioredoxin family protein [Aestuariirhabdus haliotis]
MLLDTPICDFGWQAPDFTLKDPDGKPFTLSEQLGEKGLLVAFICNHCPYVQRIAERLAADTQLLMEEGINVLAIMSNDYRSYPADAPDKMRAFARQQGFSFPYLVDEDQSVGKAFGAVCTPDFFGFNRSGELQYRGRLDDARMGEASERVPELLNAMRLIAATGQGPKEQIASMGCSIKWSI